MGLDPSPPPLDTWHNGAGRPVAYYGSSGRNYYRGGTSSSNEEMI